MANTIKGCYMNDCSGRVLEQSGMQCFLIIHAQGFQSHYRGVLIFRFLSFLCIFSHPSWTLESRLNTKEHAVKMCIFFKSIFGNTEYILYEIKRQPPVKPSIANKQKNILSYFTFFMGCIYTGIHLYSFEDIYVRGSLLYQVFLSLLVFQWYSIASYNLPFLNQFFISCVV